MLFCIKSEIFPTIKILKISLTKTHQLKMKKKIQCQQSNINDKLSPYIPTQYRYVTVTNILTCKA